MRKQRNVVFGALILAVLAALVLSLSACAKQKATASLEPYTTGWDGAVYTITPIDAYKGTISDGTNTYSYRYDTSGTGYSVTFTYPDGETYTWKEDRNFSSGATSPDFDSGKYPDGMTLDRVLKRSPAAKHEEKSTKSWGNHPVSAVRRQYQHCLSAADVASRCRLEGQGRGAVRGGACVEPRDRCRAADHCGNHDPCVIREKPAASARAAGFFALEEDLADADEDQKAAK